MFDVINAFMKGYLSQTIHIKAVEKTDLALLAEIHAASFSHGWSDGELAKVVGNESYDCLVAQFTKGKPAGFVLVRSILDEAEIITIATSPNARRKGVARELMRATIRKLEYDRKTKLFLEVDEANLAAVKLYKTLGFKQIAEREGYYSNSENETDKKSTALVMQLNLG